MRQARDRTRARAVVCAAVALVLVAGACTPLDGSSASVELPAPPTAPGVAEASWWGATTTTVAAPSTSAALPSGAGDGSDGVATPTPSLPATATPPSTEPPSTPSTSTAPTGAAPTSTAPTAPTAPTSPVLRPPDGPRGQRIAEAIAPLADESDRQLALQAMQLVRYDWVARLQGWTVRFRDGRRGVRGLTFPDQRLVEVYVRAGDDPVMLAHVFAHELGHAVDIAKLNDAARAQWLTTRGLARSTVWFPGAAGVSDFATGAGDFAESFAWVRGPSGPWSGELGPPPNAVQAAVLLVLAGIA